MIWGHIDRVVLPLVLGVLALAIALRLSGCVAPRPIPTHPDAGEVDADGGVCSRVHGDCDSCEERCRELARDSLVVLGECLRECSQ